jgi:hypothetical protein
MFTVLLALDVNAIAVNKYINISININITLPPTPGFFKLSLSLRLPNQNPVHTSALSLSLIRVAYPTHLILDLITRIIFGEQYRSLSSSLCSFLHSPVTSPS